MNEREKNIKWLKRRARRIRIRAIWLSLNIVFGFSSKTMDEVESLHQRARYLLNRAEVLNRYAGQRQHAKIIFLIASVPIGTLLAGAGGALILMANDYKIGSVVLLIGATIVATSAFFWKMILPTTSR